MGSSVSCAHYPSQTVWEADEAGRLRLMTNWFVKNLTLALRTLRYGVSILAGLYTLNLYLLWLKAMYDAWGWIDQDSEVIHMTMVCLYLGLIELQLREPRVRLQLPNIDHTRHTTWFYPQPDERDFGIEGPFMRYPMPQLLVVPTELEDEYREFINQFCRDGECPAQLRSDLQVERANGFRCTELEAFQRKGDDGKVREVTLAELLPEGRPRASWENPANVKMLLVDCDRIPEEFRL